MASSSQGGFPTATYGEVAGLPQPMPGRATDPMLGMEQMLPITASPRLQVPPGFSGATTPQGASLSKSLPILGQQQDGDGHDRQQTGSAGALKRPLTISEKPGKVALSVESGQADGTASIFRAEPDAKQSGQADGTSFFLEQNLKQSQKQRLRRILQYFAGRSSLTIEPTRLYSLGHLDDLATCLCP